MIQTVLEDEQGIQIGTPVDFPSRLLPRPDDIRFHCMRFVDPYGDTVFNQLQLEQLIEDLQLLEISTSNDSDQTAIRELLRLVQQCSDRPHIYLRFIGD
jgi:hypothetical protein